MKTLTILIFALFMTRCGATKIEEFDKFMNELDCPIILIGKVKDPVLYSSVVIKDGKGRIRTFSYTINAGNSANAIADSREVGDTLKSCK